MSLLRPKDLDALRAEVESTMTDTCEVYSQRFTSDCAGGSATSETLKAATVCRPIALSAFEREQAGAKPEVMLVDYLVPWDTDVEVTDILKISGETFEVTGILDRDPHLSKRVKCTRR